MFQPVKITVWRASSPRASPAIALPVIGLAVSAMMLGASATSVTFADSALAAVAGLRVLAESRPRALPARTPPGTPMQPANFAGPLCGSIVSAFLFDCFPPETASGKRPGNTQETR